MNSVIVFVGLNEFFNILTIYEHFPPDLHEGQLAVPDLAPPEPFGGPDFRDQLFDRVEPLRGHIMGTASCNHLIYLRKFRAIGLSIQCS